MRGVAGSQHVAGVEGRDGWVRGLLGGHVGPGVEELGCAGAVADAVVDRGAEDHSSAPEVGDLAVYETIEVVFIIKKKKICLSLFFFLIS